MFFSPQETPFVDIQCLNVSANFGSTEESEFQLCTLCNNFRRMSGFLDVSGTISAPSIIAGKEGEVGAMCAFEKLMCPITYPETHQPVGF